MHRKITQCKLHAGMRPYVYNKYFNWLALDMIQRFNTRARAPKTTRDVILSSNTVSLSTPCKGSIVKKLHHIARLPSVLDPIVMDAGNSVHSFGLFPRAPRFLPQRIAGSGDEIGISSKTTGTNNAKGKRLL